MCVCVQEKECEMVNTQGSGMILRNLEIAEGESMREITPLRDVLYRSLKIIRSLIEDFPCPDEHLLCQRIMRLLCDVRIKNDSKIEQVVLEIIHILWDKMEGNSFISFALFDSFTILFNQSFFVLHSPPIIFFY